MMRLKCLVFAFVFLVGASAASAAAKTERILSYHSDIEVHKDGRLTVTETIQVRCLQRKIKRGIYRDFPVRYVGRDFRRVIVPFEVVRVERDGRPEAYHTKSEGNYRRVYFGQKNVFLKPGVYTYKLTYRTTRQLGFFEGHDELYWNVTGNEWDFPIDKATAAVTLPKGVPGEKIACEGYTGVKGADGRDYRCSVDAAGRADFAATRPLGKSEGLTIVVTFPKGFVAEPTARESLGYFFTDNGMVLAGVIGLLVVAAYFLVVWVNVGRDPARGIVIPLFESPDGLCPAAARYVLRMGFDKTCFAASVIGLAVKKHLTIEEDDGDYSLTRTDGADESAMSRGEKKVVRRLFAGKDSIELDNANHAKFRKAIAGLKEILADQYKGKLFFANLKWFVPGVLLSLLTVAAIGLLGALVEGKPEVAVMSLWLTIWSVGVFFLVGQAIAMWKRVSAGGGERGNAIKMTLFAVPFCAGEIFVLGLLVTMTSFWLLPVLLLLGLINVRFHHLLKRPTIEGRKVMDRIEGFKMYLGTAEQDILNAAATPQKTPELFEKFLPYALALGVENAWAERFTDVLERAAATAGTDGYRPGWYRGAAFSAIGAGAFASSFSGSFTSALSSASSPPGSSSGAGGSSGGGGGGGGGGGW